MTGPGSGQATAICLTLNRVQKLTTNPKLFLQANMYSKDAFLTSIQNYLSLESSGALMISGSWGSGKTYYVNHTMRDKLIREGKYPVRISLFGLSGLDNLEKRITETFLQEYGEENLTPAQDKGNKAITQFTRWLSKKHISKRTQGIQSVSDMVPLIGQYVDVSRIVDAYTTLCTSRLPKDKLVIILDDLERAVKTIQPYLLLGAINDYVETKKYKVILIANDSYFNKGARSYLNFKEKVIERSLLFPHDILTIYQALIRNQGDDFAKLVSTTGFVSVIDPDANINKTRLDLQEDLCNIRILKFSINHFAKIYDAFSGTVQANPGNQDLEEFLLSLWALTVGLSIDYKRNRLTYLDRDAYIKASAVESFVIDLDDSEPNPFAPQDEKENQEKIDVTADRIRAIFKQYIERHNLPLVASVQIFDLVTAGISIDAKLLIQRWDEYHLSKERQKENPAAQLLNRFMMSIGSFSNEEFPEQLKILAMYTEQGAFPDDASYINAATFLQHYAVLSGKQPDEIRTVITKGIDTHYQRIVKLPILAKTSLDIIASEIPAISKWVLDYIKEKIECQEDKEKSDDIKEVRRQFQEDLPALAQRLLPDLASHSTPDFFTFPILAKIPEETIVEKFRVIQPNEVIAIGTILNSRFIQHNTNVPYAEESMFVQNLKKGIEARGETHVLADYLIKDHLLLILEELIAAIPQKTE